MARAEAAGTSALSSPRLAAPGIAASLLSGII